MLYSFEYLTHETYSLLTRLNQVKPFSLTISMVRGATISEEAFKEIIRHLENEKSALRIKLFRFIEEIKQAKQQQLDERPLQSGFTILRLRFNSILDQLDIFHDALVQRSENDTGIWLAGLDVLAEDGLSGIKSLVDIPAVMVYLERGHGAAIRRAKTRLPGGDENPVAIIQVPRERMIGSGIAGSLIHETGHQVASLLNIVPALTVAIEKRIGAGNDVVAWRYFNRCISEIICDVWAVGHLGVAATMGLMGVVTLPRYFQFRINLNDPHPAPYIRVWLSCAFGNKLFPHPQWKKLWQMWNRFYPRHGLDQTTINILDTIEKCTGAFTNLVLQQSTKEMRGKKLTAFFPIAERTPENLKELFLLWKAKKISLQNMRPTLVFAVLGQAKADMAISPSQENSILTKQLRHWAFIRNLKFST